MAPKSCCVWVQNLIENVGEKGFSVVAVADGEHRYFKLHAEPFDRGIAEQLRTVDLQSLPAGFLRDAAGRPAAIAASMELPIAFCPHCGADLQKWIKKHAKEFDKLVESTKHLA